MTSASASSRAAIRFIEPGNTAICAHCNEPVKFRAAAKLRQVVCNVYVDGRWDRVEHFHAECYEEVGEPHGTPDQNVPSRVPRLSA